MLSSLLAGFFSFQVVVQHKELYLSSLFGDYERDYLVANHIVRYGEFPLTGPDQKFGSALSSPLHFYLLAALLLISDSIVFLGIAGILLKTLLVLVVYFLGKSVFGSTAALIAALLTAGLFAASIPMPLQATFMLFFVTLSYLLMAVSFAKKSYALLLLGIFTFSISLALHFSVLAITPFFVFVVHRILKAGDQSVRKRIAVFLFFPLSIALFFSSSAYHILTKDAPYMLFLFSRLVAGQVSVHPSVYVESLLSRTFLLLEFLAGRQTGPAMVVFSVVVLVVLALYFYLEPPSPKKRLAGCCAAGIASFHLLAASLYLPENVFQPYYFFPIVGLFAVLMAEALRGVAARLFLTRENMPAFVSAAAAFLCFALIPLLILAPAYPRYARVLRALDFSALFSYPPGDWAIAVRDEVEAIKTREQRADFTFFQSRYYRDGEPLFRGIFADEILWMPLEELLSAKLTRLDDDAYRDFLPLGSEEYIFLKCDYRPDEEVQKCVTPFLNDYPDYALVKKIHSASPHSIYEMKQILPSRAHGTSLFALEDGEA